MASWSTNRSNVARHTNGPNGTVFDGQFTATGPVQPAPAGGGKPPAVVGQFTGTLNSAGQGQQNTQQVTMPAAFQQATCQVVNSVLRLPINDRGRVLITAQPTASQATTNQPDHRSFRARRFASWAARRSFSAAARCLIAACRAITQLSTTPASPCSNENPALHAGLVDQRRQTLLLLFPSDQRTRCHVTPFDGAVIASLDTPAKAAGIICRRVARLPPHRDSLRPRVTVTRVCRPRACEDLEPPPRTRP